ncbi:hypothetical protein ES705_25867 [subsurface metagenome]
MVKNATEIPKTIFNWLKETILPLSFGGAISAIYIGAIIREAPTPNPPIIRAMTRLTKLGATAENTADMKYNNDAYFNTFFLPTLSDIGPERIIARVADKVRQLTAQPNCIFVNSNCGPINSTTPDITDASNPIKNPPRATIKTIKKEWNIEFLFFME